jgi:hypothetical protein
MAGKFAVACASSLALWLASLPAKGRTAHKVEGGIIGAVGGFFAGAFIGAKLEGNCACDDPGMLGAMIGAPVGAIAGAILGVMASR